MREFGIALGLVSLLLCLLLIAIATRYKRPSTTIPKRLDGLIGPNDAFQRSLIQKLYRVVEKMPILGPCLVQIYRYLMLLSPKPEHLQRQLALTYLWTSFTASTLFFGVVFDVMPNWSTKIIAIAIWYWCFMQINNHFILRQQLLLIKELVDFVGQIRLRYFDSWMVEDALYDALQGISEPGNSRVHTQGTQMLEMLQSPEDEKALDKYNLMAPNHYLKLLATILFLTKEYGDSSPGESSRFSKSLNLLIQEMRDEILWRDRLSYALKSLNLVVIFPIFALGPIRNWASDSFDVMAAFYGGHLGYLCENAVAAIVLVSVFLLNQIQDQDGDLKVHLIIKEKVNTRSRSRIEKKARKSKSSVTIDQYLSGDKLRAMLFVMGGYVIVMVYAIWMSWTSKHQENINDATIIQSAIDIKWFLAGLLSVVITTWVSQLLYKRFRQYLIKIATRSEVNRYHTVILAIMHIPQMGVDNILQWMEKFSTAYKDILQTALLDFDSGGLKTLQSLYKKSHDVEFQKIITQLMMASESLTVVKAFEELESEKAYYLEKKKRAQDDFVTKKVSLGQIVGFAPTYATIIIYFMVPMVYASFMEMKRYMEMLQ